MVSYFSKKTKKKATSVEEPSLQGESLHNGTGISSSLEKVSRFGFLTPALVLVPAADGVRTLHHA